MLRERLSYIPTRTELEKRFTGGLPPQLESALQIYGDAELNLAKVVADDSLTNAQKLKLLKKIEAPWLAAVEHILLWTRVATPEEYVH